MSDTKTKEQLAEAYQTNAGEDDELDSAYLAGWQACRDNETSMIDEAITALKVRALSSGVAPGNLMCTWQDPINILQSIRDKYSNKKEG